MPRRRTRTDARQSRVRGPKSTCSYITVVTIKRSRGGRSTRDVSGVDFVPPRYRTSRSTFPHYDNDAYSESSFAFLKSLTRTPASGYRRRKRSSHCSGCYSNREYIPSRSAPASKAHRRKTHKNVDIPKRQKRKDPSLGSMATELGSIRVKSRRGDHQSSRAQRNPRYPAAPPPSHCSSSCDSIGRASIPQPNENWVPIPKPNRGRVESRSLQSSRMPSPAPPSIRQRPSANTLVEDQSPPTTLSLGQPGFLASGVGGGQGREWDEIRSDFSSYADSGYGLHLGGRLAAPPDDHPTRSRLRSFLSGLRRTRPPSDHDHRTTSTKKSLVHRLLGSLRDKFTHRGNTFKGSAYPSESVRPASEGSIETGGSSNGIEEDADSPVELLELDEKDFLGAERTGMSSWGRGLVNDFSTCTGSQYSPGEYDVLRAKFERDERTCE